MKGEPGRKERQVVCLKSKLASGFVYLDHLVPRLYAACHPACCSVCLSLHRVGCQKVLVVGDVQQLHTHRLDCIQLVLVLTCINVCLQAQQLKSKCTLQ